MKNEDLEVTSLSAIAHILEHASDRVGVFLLPTKPQPRAVTLSELARKVGVEVRSTPTSEAVLKMKPFEYADWGLVTRLEKGAIVLVLDHLQDPQNFGAIVRSAEAFGVDAVIIPKDRSTHVTSAVYTASAGAVETIPIVMVANVNDRLVQLKSLNYWIVGAHVTDKSTPPWEIPTFDKVALVVGAEYEGLKPSTVSHCDWVTQIPIRGRIESLNVSAATSAVLYELALRRNVKVPKG